MAKDVITRFKLETTAYDSKLRDAAKGLADYTKTATAAGKEFGKFTQSNVEAARALGNIAPSANNAKDKVKELVVAFNEASKAYNHLTKEQQQSDFGKAMAESLSKLKVQIAEAKQELYGMGEAMKNAGDGGLFSGLGSKMDGALSVFGGNMLTKGVSMLTSELMGSVQQSIELAKQGEGVRMAFERLNKPGLLDSLKEATHGTVSELELMKQAVKFDNFKLPVEDLANYLAFAQQKAKDTGESIDYLVNSIVTGLGRQSKQILDNLGISAAELTSRMNEGATMTEAVSAIIKEEMAKAGDYVETAADRAARATAEAQDKAEAFGRTAMPVAQEWTETWATLSQDAMSFANTLLGPVAKSIRSIQNILNSGPDVDDYKNTLIEKAIAKAEQEKRKSAKVGYQGMGDKQKVKAPGGYVEVTDSHTGAVIGGRHFNNLEDKNSIKDWQKGLNKSTRTSSSRSNTKKEQTELQQNQKRINDLTQKYVDLMSEASRESKPLTNEQRDRAASIKKEIRDLERRNGQLKLYQEQAKGKFLGSGAFKQQLEVDVAVNNKKIEELEKQLINLDGITIDPKTVTITATDEALPKLREIQGITIDDKTVAITADDKTQPEFREVEGIRLKGKKISVTADTMEALRAVQGINGITIDPKTVTITATDEALPKLREIQGITIDDKTMTVTADTQEALQALQGIEGVTVDTKTVKVTAETDEARQKVEELKRQIAELKDQNIQITAAMGSIGMPLSETQRMGVTDVTYGKGKNQFVPAPLMPTMDDVVRQRGGNLLDEKAMKAVQKNISKKEDKRKGDDGKDAVEVADQIYGGVTSMVSSLQQMGIELPEGLTQVVSSIGGVIGLLQSIMMIVEAIQAMQEVGTFLGIFNNGGVVPKFAEGGIVPKFADGGMIGKAALGIAIPGNSLSGDNLRLPVDGGRGVIGVNSGEVILNRAQQGVIASALDGGGAQSMQLSATIRGEDIRLAINNNGRRTGRGEYVQSTRRR